MLSTYIIIRIILFTITKRIALEIFRHIYIRNISYGTHTATRKNITTKCNIINNNRISTAIIYLLQILTSRKCIRGNFIHCRRNYYFFQTFAIHKGIHGYFTYSLGYFNKFQGRTSPKCGTTYSFQI